MRRKNVDLEYSAEIDFRLPALAAKNAYWNVDETFKMVNDQVKQNFPSYECSRYFFPMPVKNVIGGPLSDSEEILIVVEPEWKSSGLYTNTYDYARCVVTYESKKETDKGIKITKTLKEIVEKVYMRR